MLDMFLVLFLTPMYLIGYLAGFLWRSIGSGFYEGFNAVQLSAEKRLLQEFKEVCEAHGLDPLDFNEEGEV